MPASMHAASMHAASMHGSPDAELPSTCPQLLHDPRRRGPCDATESCDQSLSESKFIPVHANALFARAAASSGCRGTEFASCGAAGRLLGGLNQPVHGSVACGRCAGHQVIRGCVIVTRRILQDCTRYMDVPALSHSSHLPTNPAPPRNNFPKPRLKSALAFSHLHPFHTRRPPTDRADCGCAQQPPVGSSLHLSSRCASYGCSLRATRGWHRSLPPQARAHHMRVSGY